LSVWKKLSSKGNAEHREAGAGFVITEAGSHTAKESAAYAPPKERPGIGR
jgi:hypothetical protein